MPSVLNDWVHDLTYMQQSVLLSAIRNADGIEKFHPQKQILKFYRRCVLKSAFDGRELMDAYERGGGSFTGPISGTLFECADAFIDARDGMTLHYYAHAMHAFQILGYKYPADRVFILLDVAAMYPNESYNTRKFWNEMYVRMAHALHLWPETEEQMDARLGDKMDGWMARNDSSSTCSD